MTLKMAPPAGAVTLFDGSDLSGWTTRSGGEAGWSVADGVATVARGTGDIVSRYVYDDCWLHLEFRLADMPEKTGQAKSNSGVYLQGRYEIQVLDSHGWAVPGLGDCGAVYNQHAPLVNACGPALEWQAYDILFRAARVADDGTPLSQARMTVLLNGTVIHNNVELTGPTGGAMDDQIAKPGPLLLQDHGDPVSYRNIWVLPLPASASTEYGPR